MLTPDSTGTQSTTLPALTEYNPYSCQNDLSKAGVGSKQIPIWWGQRYQPTCTCHPPTVTRLGWVDVGLLGPPEVAGPEKWLGGGRGD